MTGCTTCHENSDRLTQLLMRTLKRLDRANQECQKSKRSVHKQKKPKRIHAKKSQVAGAVSKKALKRKGKNSPNKRKGSNTSKRKAAKKSKKGITKNINSRIRTTNLYF